MIHGMLIKIPFREGDDLGAVPVVEADPHPSGGRISKDLQEPDLRRIKYLLNIIAYLVYFALPCHFLTSVHTVKNLFCHSQGLF